MRPKKRFELRDSDFFVFVLAAGTAWHLKFRPGAARAQISEKNLRKIGTGLIHDDHGDDAPGRPGHFQLAGYNPTVSCNPRHGPSALSKRECPA